MNNPKSLVQLEGANQSFRRADFEFDRLIKTTTSICPECLEKIPADVVEKDNKVCLLYTSPSPRDATLSRMPSSA